jgi:hypothetical protein
MKRRNDDLDTVVDHDSRAVEKVLLERTPTCTHTPARARVQPLEEAFCPDAAQRCHDGTFDEAPPRELQLVRASITLIGMKRR